MDGIGDIIAEAIEAFAQRSRVEADRAAGRPPQPSQAQPVPPGPRPGSSQPVPRPAAPQPSGGRVVSVMRGAAPRQSGADARAQAAAAQGPIASNAPAAPRPPSAPERASLAAPDGFEIPSIGLGPAAVAAAAPRPLRSGAATPRAALLAALGGAGGLAAGIVLAEVLAPPLSLRPPRTGP